MYKYYDNKEDNVAFEKCIEVMSSLIMKYGPDLLEKMSREKLKELIIMEWDEAVDRDKLSARFMGYCRLVTG